MPTVVMKFGGSSVADLSRLRQVAELVVGRRRQGFRVVVVVSAMGKTTDALIAQAREVVTEPPRRELDMLVTAGERIAMALLSMAIHAAGEQAISFTGSQSGIITEDQHQGARILEVRPERLAAALEEGRIVIVAGFQGVSRKREITTLGRGGSDTTAVALAAALHADSCEIYSDVDGVYSADPNVCPEARHLSELHYEVMQTMAGAGAKVLNADAVEFARKAGIIIHARKTGDATERETVVSGTAASSEGVIAVVGATATSLLFGPGAALGGLADELLDLGARPMNMALGRELLVLVDRTGIPGRDSAPIEMVARRCELHVRNVAAVSLVGVGLTSRRTLVADVQQCLSDAGITPAAYFSADERLTVAIENDAHEQAVRRLHARFVGERG